MNLTEWGIRHKISFAAMDDLRRELIGADLFTPTVNPLEVSEAAAQANCRLAASKAGSRLWRNNLGAGKLENGSFIRWGLANDSEAVNAVCKSGDLIGIRPMLIAPAHVGLTIGQFVSREIKRPGWKYSGTPREVAQSRWIEIVVGLGGDAAFSVGSYE